MTGNIFTLYRHSDSSTGFSLRAAGNPATWYSLHRTVTSHRTLNSGVSVSSDWTHLALVQDGVNVDLYVNGISTANSSDGAAILMNSPPNATIGAYVVDSVASNGWYGFVDEAMVFNRALSSDQVQQLYRNGLNGHSYTDDGDINHDGIVNFLDYAIFANNWLSGTD